MKFVFDHTQYVPVLRLKGAEKGALRNLVPAVSSRVTPLLELVSTKNNSPSKIADDVRRSWGQAPFFLDDMNYPESPDGNALARFISAMRSHGLQSIPVTGLNRTREHQSSVAGIIASDGRGACVRLNLKDLREPFLTADLNELLVRLSLRPEQVDLIVDYEVLPVFSLLYGELCQRLPFLGQWRTFTVVSGAFCQDLREYEKNGQYTRPRDDWYFYQSQVTGKLPRIPTYGDYSIQFGLYREPPKRANVSASIRYASHDYWVIMRGEGLQNEGGPGYAQYAANAALLCEREEFSGGLFSYGDRYLENLKNRTEGTGSPETLLRAGINHHISFVVQQLSNLFAPSVGDAPFLGDSPNRQPVRVENRLSREAYGERPRPPQARPTE
jgi:hypothetical protein